jgi:hypothetical protein
MRPSGRVGRIALTRISIMFDYLDSFEKAISNLKHEQRYRVFADLERKAGQFPHAVWNGWPVLATSSSGARTTISAWANIRR